MEKTLIAIKKILLAVAIALPLMGVVACGSSHNDDPTPNPEPEDETTPRTVLVYMEAKNNLGYSVDALNLRQMQEAAALGDLGKGRLLVFHSPNSGETTIKEITATGIDTLYIYQEAPSAVTIDCMRDAWAKVKEYAPAKEYGMVLWSHATGWLQDGIADSQSGTTLYSYGSEKGSKMNITSLAKALSGQDLKFIYFDCCYMGNIETLYELRNCSEYFVASATEVPFNGMPYDLNLKYLFADPLDLAGAAQSTFDYYSEQYGTTTTNCPVTDAVIKAGAIDKLAQLTHEVYLQADTLYPEGYSPQIYSVDYKTYYNDLEHYVKAICTDSALLEDWEAALADVVEYKVAWPWIWGEAEITDYCGLSTYIIKDSGYIYTRNYNTLSWYTDVVKDAVE